MPKCRVIDSAFTWNDDRHPRNSWEETIILELHVRGFTIKHPEVREFVSYYLRTPETVRAAKYVPLNSLQLTRERIKLDKALKSLN